MIIIDVVGLEKQHISKDLTPNILKIAEEGQIEKLVPVFPSVTCTVQASLLSGNYPNAHGIISNGLYDRTNNSVSFWEQSSNLVQVDRVWDTIKKYNANLKTAVLFFQNIMYANSDVVLTPRPIHMDNEIIMWCYSKPVEMYDNLVNVIDEFDLSSYWGPLVSNKSSEWITKATELTLEHYRPNLLITYLPHLDYVFQKLGTNSFNSKEIKFVDGLVGKILEKTIEIGTRDETEFIILSEYGFNNVVSDVALNLVLRDSGLLAVRKINDKEYVDMELSKAFAMVDHQIAHIYVKGDYVNEVKKIIENTEGVDFVLDNEQKKEMKVDHERSGELIAVSEKNKWFSYYWWYDADKAPKFARKVDIHRKPGYDPCELFYDLKTKSIPLNGKLINGSHGRLPTSEEDSGFALYVSNKKNVIEKNKEGNINAVNVGRYLKNVIS